MRRLMNWLLGTKTTPVTPEPITPLNVSPAEPNPEMTARLRAGRNRIDHNVLRAERTVSQLHILAAERAAVSLRRN